MAANPLNEEYAYMKEFYEKGKTYHSNLFEITGTVDSEEISFVFDPRQKTVDLLGKPALIEMNDLRFKSRSEILLDYSISSQLQKGEEITYTDWLNKAIYEQISNDSKITDEKVREEALSIVDPKKTLKITDITEYSFGQMVRDLNKTYAIAKDEKDNS
ncbi:MAG: hypothetical protein KAS90_04960 [Candidatus Aenigmarchaeota archaeon]|nr:hypothetical protein [Candidatus Aenigmarchaeota archaeon]